MGVPYRRRPSLYPGECPSGHGDRLLVRLADGHDHERGRVSVDVGLVAPGGDYFHREHYGAGLEINRVDVPARLGAASLDLESAGAHSALPGGGTRRPLV